MKIFIEIPEDTARWLEKEAEEEFRTPEEEASIIIRKAQRKAEWELRFELSKAFRPVEDRQDSLSQ